MNKAYAAAIRMLARREHGAHELMQKLVQKKHDKEDVQQAIKECQRLGLQSDLRFAESLCRTRIRQGYGPVRINHELQQVNIDRNIIEQILMEEQSNWLQHAQAVWEKKYAGQEDDSFATVQKQKHFLQYRGFSMDVINALFK